MRPWVPTAFVGQRAVDPPRRVGREAVPAAPVPALHGPHEADVPLLDQVRQDGTPRPPGPAPATATRRRFPRSAPPGSGLAALDALAEADLVAAVSRGPAGSRAGRPPGCPSRCPLISRTASLARCSVTPGGRGRAPDRPSRPSGRGRERPSANDVAAQRRINVPKASMVVRRRVRRRPRLSCGRRHDRRDQRVVSVLMADVVGSTAIAERLGPERSKFPVRRGPAADRRDDPRVRRDRRAAHRRRPAGAVRRAPPRGRRGPRHTGPHLPARRRGRLREQHPGPPRRRARRPQAYGINTGPVRQSASVGDDDEQRYNALGDTVNVAARSRRRESGPYHARPRDPTSVSRRSGHSDGR